MTDVGTPEEAPPDPLGVKLTGKDILARAFLNAMMSVEQARFSRDIDLPEEVWKNLLELTDMGVPGLEGEWLCFNVESGEIGRAYPYKGEWRIRTASADDRRLAQLQQARVHERP